MALFDPRPAVLWKNDRQAQRHATNRDFIGRIRRAARPSIFWAKSDLGAGKVEFLQNNKVVSTMDVDVKAGMNRFQWNMRGPAPRVAMAAALVAVETRMQMRTPMPISRAAAVVDAAAVAVPRVFPSSAQAGVAAEEAVVEVDAAVGKVHCSSPAPTW